MAEQNTEDRLSLLEARVSELEHQRAVQEERDIALLARIDNFIDDLRRIERVQMRAFDAQAVQLNGLTRRMDSVEASVGQIVQVVNNHSETLTTLVGAAKDHKAAIEDIAGQVQSLAAGQQQILEILLGKPPRND